MDFNTSIESLNLPVEQPFEVDPASLCAALAKLTDGRGKQGRLYRAEVVLTLLILAKLAGQTSLAGIARFNRLRKAALCAALNLKGGRLPCANTYVYVCEKIDWEELNAVLCHFFQNLYRARQPCHSEPGLPVAPPPLRHLAIDGKTLVSTLKGSRSPGSAVHLLELYEVESGVVLDQLNVGKKQSEVSVAPRLLEGHQLAGCLISADAFHTQREWCKLVKQKGAEWLLIAKANQPGLVEDLRMLFEDEANWPKWLWLEKRTAHSVDKAHGRLEQRGLTLSSELKEFLGGEWQGVEQVFRLERSIRRAGKSRQEVIYGMLSLAPHQAGAEQVLEYIRRHWWIENRLHWRKDVILKEDQCLSRRGQTPQVLAALNNAVLGLLDYLKVKNGPAQMERFAYQPSQALALLVSNIIL